MSVFQKQSLPCPGCGVPAPFDVVHSINADRRPDLRAAILAETFQTRTCGSCGKTFRLDPELTYLDVRRGSWLGVHAASEVGRWARIEADDRALFDRGYGPAASEVARSIGAGLTVRVVFGWAAFREKLVAADADLDDHELELLKIAIVKSSEETPFGTANLRLVAVEEGELLFAWVTPRSEEIVTTLWVSRTAYDEIASDREGWAALREALSAGPFVDLQRLTAG
jgi:hypothetical protein